jgi:DNA-binding PadR family transcriptional regulator
LAGIGSGRCAPGQPIETKIKTGQKSNIDIYIVDMAALLGTFEQIVLLAVVATGEEAYGRAVLRAVQASLEEVRSVSAGAVYATLDRLEAEGLVSSRLERGTPARGGRARRFYFLTTPGASALTEARTTLEKMWHGVHWPVEVMR